MKRSSLIVVIIVIIILLGVGYLALLAPSITITDQATTPTPPVQQASNQKLQVKDITVGTGEEAKAGDSLTVNYKGTLTNGTVFDQSYGKQPFTFTLGQGQVIPGWDQGLVGMKVGGKRHLVIPPNLGYGNQAAGSIPPNSTLIFDVELLKVQSPTPSK